jgi:hypothetical protein
VDRIQSMLDSLRSYWENLTTRERLLLGGLGGVFAILIMLLPVWLLTTSISALEDENAEISASLRRISRSRDQIAARRAEQAERDARYAMGAPGEGWLAQQVEAHDLSFSRVQNEPDRTQDRFTIHTTRANFQGVGLRPTILLFADLKNSRYPVAIERIHIDHHTTGDRYNVEVGVQTFERPGARGADAGVPAARPAGTSRASGPPPR